MPDIRLCRKPVALLAMVAALAAFPAAAKDYFLVISGGYSPTGNQASIESNVLFFQRTLADRRPDDPSCEVYFADGAEPDRDVQYFDPEVKEQCPPARRIMTEIFGEGDAVGLCYRDHRVPSVTGPTERGTLERRFRELGRELHEGDRLIIYVTGHGVESYGNYDYDYEAEEWVEHETEDGEEVEYNEFDTSFYLWDTEGVDASEFGRWLDRLPADVPVVLLMVQCYSGGFAHAIFHQNNANLGLSPARRCGFFSQVHDRPAAGCTPNMREADYHEYSTYFWAALGGKTRDGAAIQRPDYDGDGKTSLAEAHAYVIIESETLDIPICTSDEFLRSYSEAGAPPTAEGPADGEAENPVQQLFGLLGSTQEQPAPELELLAAAGPLAELLPHARPEQRAILEQLPGKLELEQPTTVEAVRLAVAQAEHDLKFAHGALGLAQKMSADALEQLKEDVCALWPELSTSFSPVAAELTGERSEEFVAAVEALASYEALQNAKDREAEALAAVEEAQSAEARLQRLVYVAESVALAVNLAKSAPAEIVDRYQELLKLEGQSLD